MIGQDSRFHETHGYYADPVDEKTATLPNEFLNAAGQFAADDIRGYWTWMPLDTTIVEATAKTFTTLPVSVFLRASDCIH